MERLKTLLIIGFLCLSSHGWAVSGALYTPQDSVKIEKFLNEASRLSLPPDSWMLWFGKKFCGVSYVGGTLDKTTEEVLVVNTRQLDCTTYVEMVAALTRCAQKGETSFSAFCRHLKHIRYIEGKVAYVNRQHYFTVWMEANEREGIVKNIAPNSPFTAVQTVNLNWMSTHQQNYKMLAAHKEWLPGIVKLEQSVSGKSYRYVPKNAIANTQLFRSTIHDGDIIAIITNKKGLDTTHIGIASWHKDGLHLLNASSIHKQVIDEPMTLYKYMQKHTSHIGIRVCRVQ